ncbi:MAG: hypothetical protein COS99_04270 [Candidatus Omnitrophica bacterium CG07_land_8_20_14_0_80_42_15]|uniref:Amine oxidase domain-containing protein n=1 Tax=Candidatus Aquitaenariimonas noxiae TaxID=1974741 RepID=A0A2J0KWH0_9BACT|nr:MAG: hypothetical protein COS99_04270 [Candidatus Omnitrophica bacterium CG07_land_8_20_14_0_80_42_15]
MSKIDNTYDVVIIGAGISGLVCGCYLAKTGMKALIIEKNDKVGGCCTSFKRNGFTFDAGIRSLVGCGKNGILGKIIDELELNKKIEITRSPISDIIITPDYEIPIKTNPLETADILMTYFKEEKKKIEQFFKLILNPNFFYLYGQFNNITFDKLLHTYFKNPKLKSFWRILRADTGLPPNTTSALADIMLCRGYLTDGGYYPKGGMQNFSDKLAEKFRELGGSLMLYTEATGIKVINKNVKGVITNKKSFIKSTYIIAACDIKKTISKLIGETRVGGEFINNIRTMVPSASVFVVYLGLRRSFKNILKKCCSLWYVPQYLKNYEFNFFKLSNISLGYVICVFPSFQDYDMAPNGKESIYLYISAPFKTATFWEKYKTILSKDLINRASNIIPYLKNSIETMEIATPQTFYKYTYNYRGACRGWAAILSQTKHQLISPQAPIGNLFFSGHWTTSPIGHGGVATVAHMGRCVAKLVYKNYNKKGL